MAFQPEATFALLSVEPPADLLDLPDSRATKEEWSAYCEASGAVTPTDEILDTPSPIVTSMVRDGVHRLDQIEQLDQQDPAGILTGRLDLEKVGMFGHSIGGATAPEACVTGKSV